MKIKLSICLILMFFVWIPGVHSDDRIHQQLVMFTVPMPDRDVLNMENTEISINQIFQVLLDEPGVNKQSATDKLIKAISKAGGTLLPCPGITKILGEPTKTAAISNIQYMDQKDDGSFSLFTVEPDNQPGIFLDVVTTETFDPSYYQYEYSLRIRIMTGRKELNGTNLPIGEPEFKDYNLEDSLVVVAGEWVLVDAFRVVDVNPDDESALFVLLRLNEL